MKLNHEHIWTASNQVWCAAAGMTAKGELRGRLTHRGCDAGTGELAGGITILVQLMDSPSCMCTTPPDTVCSLNLSPAEYTTSSTFKHGAPPMKNDVMRSPSDPCSSTDSPSGIPC
jgi:hypothetical protein